MNTLHSIVLGTVQGLGEFLPISSSGHLVIIPWFMNFEDPGLTFDVALHLGTLISLLIYFYRDWIQLTISFFKSLTKKPKDYDQNEKLIWFIILATIPGALGGLLLEKLAKTLFRDPLLVAAQLALAGILLAWSDRKCLKSKTMDSFTLKDAFLIGLAQVLALIPGTSRSGATITMARILKYDRIAAARFSFLLATPIVAGACVLKLKDFLHSHVDYASILGIIVSAIVGLLAIKYMLAFLRKYSYMVFVYYRIALALVIVIGVYIKG